MKSLRTPDDRFTNLPDYPFASNYHTVGEAITGALRVHYLDEGPRDADPVLLMHGEPSWCYLYRHMIPVLVAAGHRVVAPDLVGFGRSDKPTQMADYTYARHVEWMREAMFDHLDLRHATFFGQDWGGLVGLRLVALAPDRFDARRQRVDRRGTKTVLQHLALTAMIGIIGRAQHSAHLMKDAGSITVLPQTGIGDHRQHVLVSTHDEERRIEGLLTMNRTFLEKVMMTDRWFEIVRVFEVRIGHRMSTSEGSVALIASTARPWAAMSPDTASVRPMSTVRM